MKNVSYLLLLASIAFSCEASAAGNYLGVWSGTLTQMIVAGKQYEKYDVSITISPTKYRIDYAVLGCGGLLRLLKQSGRFYRFRDELNYGLKNCDNGGTTEIHFINSNSAAFQWFDKKGNLKVEGHLTKQPQLMI